MPKLTFSLDEEAVRLLRKTAARSNKPQSLIVREAIAQYAAREEQLSESERERLLGILRVIKQRPPTRSRAEVQRELDEITRTRRTGWTRPTR